MKKFTIILITIFLMIPFNGKFIYADDGSEIQEPCELPLVKNLDIKDNMIVWDKLDEAEDGYEVRVGLKNSSAADIQQETTDNKFNLLQAIKDKRNSSIVGADVYKIPATYVVSVYTVNPENECNHTHSTNLEVYVYDFNYVINELTIEVTSNDENAIGSAEPDITAPTNSVADGDLLLTMSPIRINIKENQEYEGILVGIDLTDQTKKIYYTLSPGQNDGEWYGLIYDVQEFMDKYKGELLVIFNTDQLTPIEPETSVFITLDFGNGHEEFAQHLGSTLYELESIDGAKLKIKTMPELGVKSMLQGLYFVSLSALLGYNHSTIENNEEFILVSLNKNSSSLNDLFSIADREIGTEPLDVYAVWAKYYSDGNKKWTKGSNSDVTFTIKRTVDDKDLNKSDLIIGGDMLVPSDEDGTMLLSTYGCFKKVCVDDVELSSDKYEISEGSLNLKLKKSYLETLSTGKHNIDIYFGPAYGHLFGEDPSINPDYSKMIKVSNTLTIQELYKRTYAFPVTGID